MRSTLIVSALAALALAAPRPQEIEFDLVDAAPDSEVVTPPTTGTSEVIPAQPVAEAVAIAASAVKETTSTTEKRDFVEESQFSKRRDGDCAKQPAGKGDTVTVPADDAPSFQAYQKFSDDALAAALEENVPQGYSIAFKDLKASSQTKSYLGFKTLNSYDPITCARFCDEHAGCMAFNLYYERDPTLDPNVERCPNPPSTTNIKCVRWGVKIAQATATNKGETRDSFKVAIAGSNGYTKDAAPPSQPGFSGPVELGGAINAPVDPITKTNTYMGYKFFSFAQVQNFFNGVAACTAACTAQTAYNSRHPPKAPAKPNVCNQVVVYVLSDENQPEGIYCAMYTEAWDRPYATNDGQFRGDHYWSVSQAYSFTNTTYTAQYKPICAIGGCPNGSYKGGNCGGYGAGTC